MATWLGLVWGFILRLEEDALLGYRWGNSEVGVSQLRGVGEVGDPAPPAYVWRRNGHFHLSHGLGRGAGLGVAAEPGWVERGGVKGEGVLDVTEGPFKDSLFPFPKVLFTCCIP